MKRFLLLGILCVISISLFCQFENTVITVSDAESSVGETIEIEVNTTEVLAEWGVISFQFELAFDNSILEYNSINLGDMPSNANLIANEFDPGHLRVAYANYLSISGEGSLVNINFTALGNGISELELSEFKYNSVFLEDDNQIDGTVTISPFGEVQITIGSLETGLEEPFDLEVSTSELVTDMGTISFQFELTYDTSMMTYTGNYSLGDVPNPGSILANETEAGVIAVAYANVSPISGAGTLCALEFQPVGTEGYATASLNSFRYNSFYLTNLVAGEISFLSGPQEVELSKDIVSGWNWFSVNVAGEDMGVNSVLASIGESGANIKNQSQSAIYYEGAGWFGSLNTINNLSLYKLEANDAATWEYTGVPVDLGETTYNLNSGWNWISYAPQEPEAINYALGELENGANIKNQSQSAIYYEEAGWFGSLNTLQPTAGYMLQMNDAEQHNYPEPGQVPVAAKTMESLSADDLTISSSNDMRDPDWELYVPAYQYNGSIWAVVEINGVEVTETSGMLGCFVGDECRGIATEADGSVIDYETPFGHTIFLPMVYSNETSGETITFKYWDANSDMVYDAPETIEWEADMVIGNGFNPFVITIETGSNLPPVADAGEDQTVFAGDLVQLDGSGSYDPDGEGSREYPDWTINPPDYEYNGSIWGIVMLDGVEVTETTGILGCFVGDECRGIAVAPESVLDYAIPFGHTIFLPMVYSNETSGETFTFKYWDATSETIYDIEETIDWVADMVVGDGWDPFEFTVNTMPTSNLEFLWTAPEGITLNDNSAIMPSFTAPDVTETTEYPITLIVSDGETWSEPDEVVITVYEPNNPPVANAGVDFSVNEGLLVTLDGSESYDPENELLSYLWTAPDEIILNDPASVNPVFTAPAVNEDTPFTLTLQVTDVLGQTDQDEVIVTVQNYDLEDVIITVESVEATEGDTITVAVNTSELLEDWGSMGVEFDLDYDPAYLNYLDFEPGDLIVNPMFFQTGTEPNLHFSSMVVSVIDPDGNAGSIALLNFEVIGMQPVTADLQIHNFSFNNTQINNLVNGAVTITPLDNHPPVIALPDDFTFDEDDDLTVDFADESYVSDPDQDELTLSVAGYNDITVDINGLVVTFGATDNWNGDENITFTVDDGYSRDTDSDEVQVIVIPVNDAPVLSQGFADLQLLEDFEVQSINLEEYFDDVDEDELDYDVNFNNYEVSISINDSMMYINSVTNWNGTANVTVTADDNQSRATAEDSFAIVVSAVNDDPVVSTNIPLQNRLEDFTNPIVITLSEYITDVDNDLIYTYAPLQNNIVEISINDSDQMIITAIENASGSIEIVVTGTEDQENGSSVSTPFTVNVEPVNDAPVAVDDDETTSETLIFSEDAAQSDITEALLANDTDIDSENLTITNLNDTYTQGTVILSDGSVTYNPNGAFESLAVNETNTDTFIYTLSDGDGGTDTANVTITITGVNDAPVADAGGSYTGEENELGQCHILLDGRNSYDVDNVIESYTWSWGQGQTAEGDTVTVLMDHSITEVTLVVTDPSEEQDTDVATVSISEYTNQAPVAYDDSLTGENAVSEDLTEAWDITQIILSNDTDHENDEITVNSINTNQTAGSAVFSQEDNSVTYLPNGVFENLALGETGTDTLTYTITDGISLSNEATVIITINGENDLPFVENELVDFAFDEDTVDSTSINLSSVFNDVDSSDILTYAFSGNENITVSINPQGIVTLTPPANWYGTEYITFTATDSNEAEVSDEVMVTVNNLNDEPTIDLPETFSFDEDVVQAAIDYSQYISDADSLGVSPDSLSLEATGNLQINIDITGLMLTYSNVENWNGTETITFTVNDNEGRAIASDIIAVTVDFVNDQPHIIQNLNEIEFAEDTIEYEAANLNNVFGDYDLLYGDSLSYSYAQSDSSHLTITIADSLVILSPETNWHGQEFITLTATDNAGLMANENVNVIVTSVNDAPVAEAGGPYYQSAGDDGFAVVNLDGSASSDIDGIISSWEWSLNDSVFASGNTVTHSFTPGDYEITLTVTDNEGATALDLAQVSVSDFENQAPVAVADSFQVNEDSQLTGNVLSNDSDDGFPEPLTALLQQTAENGVVNFNPNGDFSYIPALNWNGQDSFVYKAFDGLLYSEEVAVTITVNPVNDAPLFTYEQETIEFNEDETETIDFSSYISDVDEDDLTLYVNQADSVNAAINEFQITFSAPDNWFGTDDIVIGVTDNQDRLTAEVNVQIQVISINDAPVANAGGPYNVMAEEGTDNAMVNLNAASSYDIDGEIVSYSWSWNTDATASGQNPQVEFPIGETQVSLIVTDDEGLSGEDTTSVIVIDYGIEPPVAENDSLEVSEDGSMLIITGVLLANDYDPDSSFDIDSIDAANTAGQVILADGEVSYSPNEAFEYLAISETANDSFTYILSDGNSTSNEATVTITITGENDAPTVANELVDFAFEEDTVDSTSINLSSVFNDVDSSDILTYAFSGNENITVDIAPEGIVTLTPAANWYGIEYITFTATDNNRAEVSDEVKVTVNNLNDAPTIDLPETFSFTEDVVQADIDYSQYISDVDTLGALSDSLSLEASGNFQINVDITGLMVTYGNVENWNGTESITFTVNDNEGRAIASDTIVVTVDFVNDAPVVDAELADFSFDEDTIDNSINLSDVFTDPDLVYGDTLAYSYSGNVNIDIMIDDNGGVTLTPAENWNGTETILFTATDNYEEFISDEVTITIDPVNDIPMITLPDSLSFNEDEVLVENFNSYLIDVDGDTLAIAVSETQNIVVEISDLIVTFSAAENWNGEETLTFTVDDGIERVTASDDVLIIVNSVNDAPVAVAGGPYEAEAGVNGMAEVTLDASDSYDIDGEISDYLWTWNNTSLSGSMITASFPVGTTEVSLAVTDNEGAVGTDTAQVVVSGYINISPVAVTDEFSGDEDSLISGNVLENDYDEDSYPDSILIAQLENDVEYGELILNPDGSFEYTPDENFFGADSFTYSAYDGLDYSEIALVTISINPVNDAPEILLPEFFTFDEDESLSVNFDEFVSDVDQDDLELTVSGNQQIMVDIEDLMVEFSAPTNWSGSENITFTINDQVVRLTASDDCQVVVNPVNDPPQFTYNETEIFLPEDDSITVNFTPYLADIENDPLSMFVIGNENVEVTIDGFIFHFSAAIPDWNGSENVTIGVQDDQGGSTELDIDLVVTPVNDAPVIDLPDSFSFNEDEQLLIDFSLYASDVDEDILYLTAIGNQEIAVEISSMDVNIFAPENWFGQETITFTVDDGIQRSVDSDSVVVIVESVNDSPIAITGGPYNGESYLTGFDNITLNAEASFDIDGQIVSYQWAWNDTMAQGIIVTADFDLGETIVTLEVTDDLGAVGSAETTVTVIETGNEEPVAINDEYFGMEDDTVTGNVLDNDSDPDDYPGEGLMAILVSDPLNGSLEFAEDGSFIFVPEANWFGSTSFSYQANDYIHSSEIATVNITIEPVNDPPVIELPESFIFNEDESLVIDFTQYVSDIDEDMLSLSYIGNETIIVEIVDMMITFSAPADWYGSEMITFTVSDNISRIEASDIVEIIVLPVNDNPVIELPDNFEFNEDETLLVDFSPYISDIDLDSLTLSYNQNQYINLMIDDFEVTFSADENWFGSEIITFTVNDNQDRAVASDQVTIIVIPVNDLPVITNYSPQQTQWLLYEYEESSLDFSVTAEDIDSDIQYLWLINGEDQMISENQFSYTFGEDGIFEITAQVMDEEYNISQTWNIEVLNGPLWDIAIYENSTMAYLEININDLPAEIGDIVGAFVGDECRGVGEIMAVRNAQVQIEIFGNQVEEVEFYIWDDSENLIIPAETTAVTDPGGQIGYPFYYFPVNAYYYETVTQSIQLNTGWNLISFNVIPEDCSIEAVFAPIMADLDKVKDILDSYDPEVPEFLNTLQMIETGYGYFVNVDNPVVLEVTGEVVPNNTAISLQPGWNLAAYTPQLAQPVEGALESISLNLLKVKDALNSYDPTVPFYFNTLTTMMPGYGYWIKVNDQVDLVYNIPERTSAFQPQRIYHWQPQILTNSAVLYAQIFTDECLSEDDQIAAFVNNQCRAVGNIIIDDNSYYASLVVNCEDCAEISFRIFLFDDNQVISNSETITVIPGETYPQIIELYFEEDSSEIVSAYRIKSIYPNPFNPKTTISFELAEDSQVSLEIFNLKGQKVETLIHEYKEAGSYNITWSPYNKTSGIYFVRLDTGFAISTKKVILMK